MSDDLSAGTAHVVLRDSPIHGRGGFARVALAAGARVLVYVGERIDKAESLRRCRQQNEAIFFLNETTDLDGSVAWNPARGSITVARRTPTPSCSTAVFGSSRTNRSPRARRLRSITATTWRITASIRVGAVRRSARATSSPRRWRSGFARVHGRRCSEKDRASLPRLLLVKRGHARAPITKARDGRRGGRGSGRGR